MKEGCNRAWSMGRVLSCLSYSKLNVLSAPSERFGTATTINRELIERFWKLKALYNLKKSIQCADTHNYANRWYTSIQNIRKLTFSYKAWQKHTHTRSRAPARARTHTHTHTHPHRIARTHNAYKENTHARPLTCGSNISSKHARKHEASPPRVKKIVPSQFK